MSTRRLSRLAATAAAAPIMCAIASGLAHADAPAPGDPCPALHETTADDNDQPMWCNPNPHGVNTLVWEYGGAR